MKKLIFVVAFLYSLCSYSQYQNLDYVNLTKPTPDNTLSNYFKNAIPARLLNNLKYSSKKQNIILTFYINKLKEPYKIAINNSSSSILNDAIKKAFLNYPLENLGLENLGTNNKYSFQIIIRQNSVQSIFSCSSFILVQSPPVCNSCKDLEFYEDIVNCTNTKIREYFKKNLDSTVIQIVKKTNPKLKANLRVNKKGKLTLKEEKKSDLFLEITNNFPVFEEPAKLNGKPTNYNYTYYPFTSKIISEPNKELNIYSNSTNDFAKFISEKLENKYIENAGLNRMNKTLSINFELDKKGKPFNILTTARSYSLEKRILELFNEYPIKKLDLGNRETLSRYYTSILEFKNDKVIVETFTAFASESVPIFPGCKKSKNIVEAKKCFSKGVQNHFASNFNTKLPNRLGLSTGRKRVFIGFKINTKGKIIDIKVRAPHPKIKEEVIYVMKRLPKVKPGLQRGKPVSIKYSIPFTMIVE